jgi:hypothetical protein
VSHIPLKLPYVTSACCPDIVDIYSVGNRAAVLTIKSNKSRLI